MSDRYQYHRRNDDLSDDERATYARQGRGRKRERSHEGWRHNKFDAYRKEPHSDNESDDYRTSKKSSTGKRYHDYNSASTSRYEAKKLKSAASNDNSPASYSRQSHQNDYSRNRYKNTEKSVSRDGSPEIHRDRHERQGNPSCRLQSKHRKASLGRNFIEAVKGATGVRLCDDSDEDVLKPSARTDQDADSKTEAMYLPNTKDLDQIELKQNILVGLSHIKRKTGISPSLRTDEDDQLYFLLRSDSFGVFGEAKTLIIEHVHKVITKMRQAARRSRAEPKESSSKKSSRSRSSRRSVSCEFDYTKKQTGTSMAPAARLAPKVERKPPPPPSVKPEQLQELPPVVSAVALNFGVTMGSFGYIYNLEGGVTESKLRSAIACDFSVHFDRVQHVAFKPYESPECKGLAIVNFQSQMQKNEFMRRYIEIDGHQLTAMDGMGMKMCGDHFLKSRFAQLLQNTVEQPRMPGIFPLGVQPHRIVLVVDDSAPHIDLKKFQADSNIEVLSSSSLDASGFFELIRNDENLDKDNVLYVIVPWLDFFLTNVNAQQLGSNSGDGKINLSLLRRTAEKVVSTSNIVREFSYNPVLQSDYNGQVDFSNRLHVVTQLTTPHVKACVSLLKSWVARDLVKLRTLMANDQRTGDRGHR